MTDSNRRGHLGQWPSASGHWERFGPPLRPGAGDLAFLAGRIGRWAGAHAAPRALVLGATCEYHALPWPAGTDLLAVDQSQDMLERVWPGPPRSTLCADWCSMALPPASRDLALTDGGLNVISYPEGLRRLAARLGGIVAPGGLALFRVHAPPATPASFADVIDDLTAGAIPDVHHLKIRLWMALRRRGDEGIELAHVWERLQGAVPDLAALAVRIGWPPDHARVLEDYRGCPARYFFPDVDEILRTFCGEPGGFELDEVHDPPLPCGVRCPTLVLRRTART